MNKSTIGGIVIGVAVATAVGAIAGYSIVNEDESVNEDEAAAQIAQQNCYEVGIERAAEPEDEKRIAGTVIGALVGGAVGRDVGDKDITTAAGAAAGAFAGNQAQKKFQENRTETATEVRCDP